MAPGTTTVSQRIIAPAGAKRLLCLDGGGVRGISSLMILDAIMKEVAKIEGQAKDHAPPLPHEYFDLAGGTSTGGLAALMMFRLKLSTAATMGHYDNMSRRIFSPSLGPLNLDSFGRLGFWAGKGILNLKAFLLPARFSAVPLERAIRDVVSETIKIAGEQVNTLALLDKSEGPKMLMCSTLADKGETVLFRSYEPPADVIPTTRDVRDADFSDITIIEAARATSAAPTYLPEMVITRPVPPKPEPVVFRFWDGGLLNNNPIDQVWDARLDLASDITETPVVSCVVSIGTSWSTPQSKPGGFVSRFVNTLSQTVSFATNTEAKHRDFERRNKRRNVRLPENERTAYFHFNAPTGDQVFGLDDWQSMPKLKELTSQYLADPETKDKITECAQVLARSVA